jgi:hypothetical protein
MPGMTPGAHKAIFGFAGVGFVAYRRRNQGTALHAA